MPGSLCLLTEELFLRACYPMAMIWRVVLGLIRPITVSVLWTKIITHSPSKGVCGWIIVFISTYTYVHDHSEKWNKNGNMRMNMFCPSFLSRHTLKVVSYMYHILMYTYVYVLFVWDLSKLRSVFAWCCTPEERLHNMFLGAPRSQRN